MSVTVLTLAFYIVVAFSAGYAAATLDNKRRFGALAADFEALRAAVALCLGGGERLSEPVTRPSGSANGGTVVAARWWWVLRGALEKTWDRYGRDVKKVAVWEPEG